MSATSVLSATEFEARLEQYLYERSEEWRAVRVCEKEISEQAEIVRRYADLFSRDQLDALRESEECETGETRELKVKGWDELGSIEWSVDGKSLLPVWHHDSDTALLKVALEGKVSVLLRSSNPNILGAIPAPDGRSLAIAGASTTRNAWQIENF